LKDRSNSWLGGAANTPVPISISHVLADKMEYLNNSTGGKSGNRCDHDPSAPRFFAPADHPHTEQHRNRPHILKRLTKAVEDYFDSPKILPTLNAANGSKRQQRSERREACCAVLGVMIHYLDLVTLRVGIPQPDGGMAGIPMDSKDLDDGTHITGIAELAGICLRRAERAVEDLKAAGIITVHSICEKIEEGVYKGYAAIRTVSAKLFDALGLGRWLAHERRKAKERRDKKTEKARRKALANVMMAGTALEQQLKDLKRKQAEDKAAGIEQGPQRGNLSPVAEICLAAMRQTLGMKPDTS